MAPKRGKCVFNPDLAKKFPYMEKVKNKTDSDVHCNLCNSDINIASAGKSDITNHLNSAKHKKALQAVSTSRPVTQYFPSATDNNVAACEGVWSYHVIKENHSFLSSDCASKLFRTCFEMRKFHCARTKCEAIATNVLAPYCRDVLKNNLAKRRYLTLSTDASNHGNVKMMAVVVRFFVPTIGVEVKMLDFTSEKGETSEIIATMLMETAIKMKSTIKLLDFAGITVRQILVPAIEAATIMCFIA